MPVALSPTPTRAIGAPLPALPLRRSISWSLLGNAIYAGCQWSMLVVLAKLTTPAMVGQFSLALAITAPVFVCVGLNLRLVLSTDARREYAFGSYLGLWLIALAIAYAVIAGLITAFGCRSEMRWVILILAASKTFDSLSDLIYGLLLQHDRMDRIATSRILQGTLQLVTLGVLLSLTGAVVWGVVGLAIVSALVTAGYDLRSAVMVLSSHPVSSSPDPPRSGGRVPPVVLLRPHGSPRVLVRLAWLAFPLGVLFVLDSLNASIPRYFVERHGGNAALGLFTAVAYLMMAGVTVVGAVLEAARPRLARQFIEDLPAFRSLLVRLVLAGVAMGGAGILVASLIGKQILTLVYRPEYASQTDLFVWVMVGAALWYLASIVETAINAARLFHVEPPLHLAAVAGTTLGCLFLVPRYGSVGAGWALCLGMAARLTGTVFVMRRALLAQEVGNE
jgi:O-antigen/teichoic acid export membrane protein